MIIQQTYEKKMNALCFIRSVCVYAADLLNRRASESKAIGTTSNHTKYEHTCARAQTAELIDAKRGQILLNILFFLC